MDNITRKYEFARSILGEDFITPEEISKARILIYSDALLNRLHESLPSKEIIQQCLEHGFVLVAGPPATFSLLSIREINPHLFFSMTGGWFADERHKFAYEDMVLPRWLILRKNYIPGSTNKVWSEQKKLVPGAEYIPNVSEVAWGLTSYKIIRNCCLLGHSFVRTSSLVSKKNHIIIGDFNDMGVTIAYEWDQGQKDTLGILSAMKRTYHVS